MVTTEKQYIIYRCRTTIYIGSFSRGKDFDNRCHYHVEEGYLTMQTYFIKILYIKGQNIYSAKVMPLPWRDPDLPHRRLSLHWRHNGRYSVSNHQHHDWLFNRLFRHRLKKHQSFASLAFVRGIHRWPVNSLHKEPVTRKMFPFDDVIMYNDNLKGVFLFSNFVA